MLKIWKNLRKAQIHDLLKMFMWRVLADMLPTKGRLARILDVDDRSFNICGELEDETIHLFKNCIGIRALALASGWGGKLDAWPWMDIVSFIEMGLNPHRRTRVANQRSCRIFKFLYLLDVLNLAL